MGKLEQESKKTSITEYLHRDSSMSATFSDNILRSIRMNLSDGSGLKRCALFSDVSIKSEICNKGDLYDQKCLICKNIFYSSDHSYICEVCGVCMECCSQVTEPREVVCFKGSIDLKYQWYIVSFVTVFQREIDITSKLYCIKCCKAHVIPYKLCMMCYKSYSILDMVECEACLGWVHYDCLNRTILTCVLKNSRYCFECGHCESTKFLSESNDIECYVRALDSRCINYSCKLPSSINEGSKLTFKSGSTIDVHTLCILCATRNISLGPAIRDWKLPSAYFKIPLGLLRPLKALISALKTKINSGYDMKTSNFCLYNSSVRSKYTKQQLEFRPDRLKDGGALVRRNRIFYVSEYDSAIVVKSLREREIITFQDGCFYESGELLDEKQYNERYYNNIYGSTLSNIFIDMLKFVSSLGISKNNLEEVIRSYRIPECCHSKINHTLSRYQKCRSNSYYIGKSNIQGIGLFSNTIRVENEIIIEYTGHLITSSELSAFSNFYSEKLGIEGFYIFQLKSSIIRNKRTSALDATILGNCSKFINQSCDPNCYSTIIIIDGVERVFICASRLIYRDEELTYDYMTPGSLTMCKCSSKSCKSKIKAT